MKVIGIIIYLIAEYQYQYGDAVSRRAVDAVFQALFILTEIRAVLRETAPHHDLDPDTRRRMQQLCDDLEHEVSSIRKELLP